MEIISLISSKKGKLYIKFFLAAALLVALVSSYFALAANPSASPAIVSDRNFSNSNISAAFANNVIFGYANFTSENGTQEAKLTIVRRSYSLAFVGCLRCARQLPSLRLATNSAFKYPHFVRDSPSLLFGEWFKRTLYQPQNRSLVGYWKLDGNATGDAL